MPPGFKQPASEYSTGGADSTRRHNIISISGNLQEQLLLLLHCVHNVHALNFGRRWWDSASAAPEGLSCSDQAMRWLTYSSSSASIAPPPGSAASAEPSCPQASALGAKPSALARTVSAHSDSECAVSTRDVRSSLRQRSGTSAWGRPPSVCTNSARASEAARTEAWCVLSPPAPPSAEAGGAPWPPAPETPAAVRIAAALRTTMRLSDRVHSSSESVRECISRASSPARCQASLSRLPACSAEARPWFMPAS